LANVRLARDLADRQVGEVVQDDRATVCGGQQVERSTERNAVRAGRRHMFVAVRPGEPRGGSGLAPSAGGQVPGDAPNPGGRIVEGGDPLPASQRPAERLLHHVLGGGEIVRIRDQLDRERLEVGRVELLEIGCVRRSGTRDRLAVHPLRQGDHTALSSPWRGRIRLALRQQHASLGDLVAASPVAASDACASPTGRASHRGLTVQILAPGQSAVRLTSGG